MKSSRLRRGRRMLFAVLITLLFMPPQVFSVGGTDPGYSLLPIRNFKRFGHVRSSREAHGSHYFLSTSAIPLAKRSGYYKNTMVSLNSAAYGITQHLGISGGFDLFSLITSRGSPPVWYTRLQLSGSASDRFHLGAQAMYIAIPLPRNMEAPPILDVPMGFACAMGMITIGDAANQLTLSAGYLHDGQQAARGPLLNVSGMVRVAVNVALVTEHWLFTDPLGNYPIHSVGVRILGDHLAIDVGLAYDRELAATITPIGLPFASGILNF